VLSSPVVETVGEPDSSVADDSVVPTVYYVPYERIVPGGGPNGEDCTTTGYQEVPAGTPGLSSGIPDRLLGNIRIIYPECPADEASAVSPDSPLAYAESYWQEIRLPKPEPYIGPGRAITGMLAYLETRSSTTQSYVEPNTPFGALTIRATGMYYVDWGDGTHTGPHPFEGGPWPDGRITHEYIHVGKYDVVVTERWSATWKFGTNFGVLNELRTTGRIEDFPVQQIQAVVIR
jgi:hypothetical protein